MTPELFHLLLMGLALGVFIWIMRLMRVSISIVEILVSVRLAAMNLVNISRWIPTLESRIDQSSRKYLQDLIKGTVDPPSAPLGRFNSPFHLYKDSFQITTLNGKTSLSFKFDAKVDSAVQFFWGVNKKTFYEVICNKTQDDPNFLFLNESMFPPDFELSSDVFKFDSGNAIIVKIDQESSGSQQNLMYSDDEEPSTPVVHGTNEFEGQVDQLQSTPDPRHSETIPLLVLIKNCEWSDPKDGIYQYAALSFKNNLVGVTSQYLHTILGAFQIQDIYGNQDENSSSEECVVCLSEPRGIILLPCRHLCVCHTCFLQIDKCPICRNPIRAFIVKEQEKAQLIQETIVEGVETV
jgi:hypothetical protein